MRSLNHTPLQFINLFLIFIAISVFVACSADKKETEGYSKEAPPSDISLFSLIEHSHSGVTFQNEFEENIKRMWYNFPTIYDGGGVALGDINNDGLTDIYFTGNEVPNKLYLNKGDFQFEDITEKAGVAGGGGWHNGPTMVDINGDGYLDIYVCRGGWIKDENQRSNLLFINQKDGTFRELAFTFGLREKGYSFQSLFLDYDMDGDLDVYIINHPTKAGLEIPEYKQGYVSGSKFSKDRLYRNNGNNTFSDVTDDTGLGGTYGYGLSVTSGDLDNNGYPDIYVSNDYTEPDYLWMNNGDGTFTNKVKEATGHISLFAMGGDISDFNNDGMEDIFITEMLSRDYKRSKTNMGTMSTDRFELIIKEGFHRQYMHNSLQLNLGNGHFSEVSQLAGLSKTDWSWACFLTDFDNDGLRDAFVSNGYRRDVLDRDSAKKRQAYLKKNNDYIPDLNEFLKLTPVNKAVNCIYKNKDGYRFDDKSQQWGMTHPSFSNGAAFADLDNDGDLDLVLNNFEEPAFIYRNNAEKLKRNYLRIKLQGPKGNPHGIGSKITVKYSGQQQFEEFKTTRGYLSSVEPIAHFGLGDVSQIDEIKVKWFDGKTNKLNHVRTNQVLAINYSEATDSNAEPDKPNPIIKESTKAHFPNPYTHQENEFDDYQHQILLPHRLSRLGPFTSSGDVNGDDLEDCFVGGANGQAGQLMLQNNKGQFITKKVPALVADRAYEDMGSLLFDADNDNDLDLYIVSGGTEELYNDPYYLDRLYINDGKGNFKRDKAALPNINSSNSCVIANDFDGDGDEDLFVGGRAIPNVYPAAAQSVLLRNDGGKFTNITDAQAPYLNTFGMVTSALWTDINKDGLADLLVTGEWMPLTVLINKNGSFENATERFGLSETVGWWNRIEAADIDDDGDIDYIAGNLGLNYKFKAKKDKPFHVYCNDFDDNGSYDIFLAKDNNGQQVPVRGRECSSQQVPEIATKFASFKDFAEADINQIIGPKIDQALHYEANLFSSVILRNNKGTFEIEELPMLSQLSTINGIVVNDFNKDGITDILTAGNMYHSEIETTRADASVGLMLQGKKDGTFKALTVEESGVFLPYDVKDLRSITVGNKEKVILVPCNDGMMRSLSY